MPGITHDTAMNLRTTALPPVIADQASGRWLHGRRGECELLDRLVADVRAGHSRVLVLRGEPGTGKTALLDYLAQHAAGCRITRVTGVEPEMEMTFAGLHQLCAPFLVEAPSTCPIRSVTRSGPRSTCRTGTSLTDSRSAWPP